MPVNLEANGWHGLSVANPIVSCWRQLRHISWGTCLNVLRHRAVGTPGLLAHAWNMILAILPETMLKIVTMSHLRLAASGRGQSARICTIRGFQLVHHCYFVPKTLQCLWRNLIAWFLRCNKCNWLRLDWRFLVFDARFGSNAVTVNLVCVFRGRAHSVCDR